jgi:hypothetical protein
MIPFRSCLVVVALLVAPGAPEAGEVVTYSGSYPAVVDMLIPDAGHVNADGQCTYDVAQTPGVTVRFHYDAPLCRATVSKVDDAQSGARTGGENIIPPLEPAVDPDDWVGELPAKQKKSGTFGPRAPDMLSAEPLSSNLVAPRGAISCPRMLGYNRMRANLVHWYGPHNHFHAYLKAEARFRFWENLYSYAVGDIHAYRAPQDWAAYSISTAAYNAGWRWWRFSNINVVANGPHLVSSRATTLLRSQGYFGSYHVALLAVAANGGNLNPLGYCRSESQTLDSRLAPYEVWCTQRVRPILAEGCYY